VSYAGEPREEYTSLREELVRHDRARLAIFGVAVCSVGVVLSITFLLGMGDPGTLGLRLALVYLAHVVVIVALLLTHRRTHERDFTAGYLRTFVAPRIRGLRKPNDPLDEGSRRAGRTPLHSSKALGGCYALLVSAIVAAGIANGLYVSLWAVGLPILALTGVLSANWLFMSEAEVVPPNRSGPGDAQEGA
jgi:hypothetical protein